jgi:hypothetical protein
MTMQTIYHGAAVVPRRRSKTRGSPLTPAHQLEAAENAELSLRKALHYAKLADAPLLAGRIRAAIKSAGGAIRHRVNWESRERRRNAKRQQASPAPGYHLQEGGGGYRVWTNRKSGISGSVYTSAAAANADTWREYNANTKGPQ